jgi:hypothetical protein
VAETVLVVPADPLQPCREETLPDDDRGRREVLQRLVGGQIGRGVYDRDAVVLVNDDGFAKGLPINMRASRYAFEQSEAAKRRGGTLQAALAGGTPLVGDAVVVGESRAGNSTGKVPDRLYGFFGVERRGAQRGSERPGVVRPPLDPRTIDGRGLERG